MRASSSFYLLALLASTTSTFAAPVVGPRDLATVDTSKSGNVGVLDTTCAQCAGSPNDQSTGVPGVASADTDKTADVKAVDNQVLPLSPSDGSGSDAPDGGLANLSAPVKAISSVPSGDATDESAPFTSESSDGGDFDLIKAVKKLLGGGQGSSDPLSDEEKGAIFKAIKTYLADGGAVPTDDTLASMGFPLRFRKSLLAFLASGNPSDFPTADELNADADTSPPASSSSDPVAPLSAPVEALTAPSSADASDPVEALTSAATAPDANAESTDSSTDPNARPRPVKLVLRPFTSSSDSIPSGTIACPDQDPSAPLAANLEAALPHVVNLCLDLTAAFVTPAEAAVCPEDRAVFLGVQGKSQVGEGLPTSTDGKGPVVRLCEEASVPEPAK